MTHEQQALWHRIRDFQIDVPDASYPFSSRLARENGWTPAYAARVIDEYRKFAFLAVASGHGVTPSKAVDEAWHLHLLYTRNYWEDFCPHALGRPLHHHPSNGNAEDDLKYEGWYDATLASYERLFGQPPPGDVWSAQTAPVKRRLAWPWLAFLPFVLAGCDEPLNLLDWSGPAFLQLFAVLYGAAVLAALAVRHALRMPVEGPPPEEWNLHVYEKAFLNEGPRLALATALARLTVEGQIEVDRKKGRFRAYPGVAGDHPLDRAILRAAASTTGAEYETVHRVVKPTLDEMETSLRRQGLWLPGEQTAWFGLMVGGIASLPLLLGVAKISVGMSRDRPVGFLIAGCIAALVLNIALAIPPKRSRYGDSVLDALRTRGSSARYAGGRANVPASDLAVGMALFGLAALDGGPYADLRRVVVPPPTSGGGGDSGSGCGGGGDSGGCGGGGGCGGCGGGGD